MWSGPSSARWANVEASGWGDACRARPSSADRQRRVAGGLAMGGPAAAQVLDIGADGAVTRYAGPAIYTDEGARPLIPRAAGRRRPAPAEIAAGHPGSRPAPRGQRPAR